MLTAVLEDKKPILKLGNFESEKGATYWRGFFATKHAMTLLFQLISLWTLPAVVKQQPQKSPCTDTNSAFTQHISSSNTDNRHHVGIH